MTDYLRLAQERAQQTQAQDEQDNPYLPLAREQQRLQQNRARTVIEAALKDDPDLAAERLRLSQTSGLPLPVIERNLEELRVKERARAIDLVRMAEESPVLYRQLVDPTFAATSVDDLDTLKNLERSVGRGVAYVMGADGKGGLPKDLAGAAVDVGLGATAGVGEMIFNVAGTLYDLVGWQSGARDMRGLANRSKEVRDALGFQPESSTGQAVKSGLQSSGTNLALLPLGLARSLWSTANQAAAAVAGTMATGVGADAYMRAREQGRTSVQSLIYAIPEGTFEFLFERIPASKLFGDIAANTGLLKMIGRQTLSEGWTEQVTTLAQDFNEWMNLNPDKTLAEFINERPEAAYQTFIATLVGVGVQTSTIKAINKIVETASNQSLVYEQDLFQQQLQLAAASMLRARSPEQFRDHIQRVVDANDGAKKEIYVDAEVLNQLPPELLAQLPESVREALPSALEANSTVAIPMADVLTVAPGTELEQVLNDHARMRPNAPSRAEAELTAQLLAQDAERVLKQAADTAAWQQSTQAVQQAILDQLNQTGRFTPDVNEAYATLQANFFSTMAARVGLTPQELYERYQLKVAAKSPGGQAYNAGRGLTVEDTVFADMPDQELEQGLAAAPAFETTYTDAQGERFNITLRREVLGMGADRQLSVIVEARTADGSRRGMIDFAVQGNTLAAENTIVAPAYRRRGLAEAMYRAAREAGYDIMPGRKQTADGERMVASLREKGVINIERGLEQAPRAELPETIEVDGVQRPTRNSSGQPIAATEEGVRNFWRWFGDSKVVDAQGKPLVVYHGTSATTLEAFDDSMSGSSMGSASGLDGFYFTADPVTAGLYAKASEKSQHEMFGRFYNRQNIMPVYLSMQNPLIYKKQRGDQITLMDTVKRRVIAEAKQGGYDGVIFQGFRDTPTGRGANVADVYVAFRPEQIKSATGNQGTFDPADPNILKQGPRGTFNPERLLITLNETADLSTFLHESGHFFLEVLADLASQPDAPQQIVDDMATILKWFGIKGDERVGGADAGGALAQTAYHGTPHRGIDKFSTDKIGTGEGAQAYGWGLYFASKREIADWYRRSLSRGVPVVKVNGRAVTGTVFNSVANRLNDTLDKITAADVRAEIERSLAEAQASTDLLQKARARELTAALKKLDSAKSFEVVQGENPGQLYEVDIPEDSEMLLWDRPLSEQPKAVREALERAAARGAEVTAAAQAGTQADPADFAAVYLYDYTRQENLQAASIYKMLGKALGSDKAASEALAALGIKGIKYLDGASRRAGDGTFNYVIFSGDDVQIRGQFYQGGNLPTDDTQPVRRTPLETWNAMTLDQKRKYHERFAESFEQYLFEGKAPSQELQPLFRRFRSWLVNVYKSLKQFMQGRNLQLGDDIRRVFDRLIATDEQIAQAEEAAGMLPDFEATNEAIEKLQARSLRDLKWTVNARNKALKALQKQAAKLRKEVEAEVRAEVEQQPIYRAMRWLKKGEAIDPETGDLVKAEKGYRLSTAALAEMYPETMLGRPDLTRLRGMTSKEGLHPDLVADMFGFASGDQLVRALLDAQPINEVIEGMTDQRMLERYGDLATPEAREAAANEAVHNEARARALATELKSQAEMINQRQDTGRTDARGRAITVNAVVEAAKQFALNLAARRRIKDLKNAAWQHRAAEARAGKRWQQLTAEGKTEEAVQAKRDQLLNNYAAKALQDAQTEVKKALEFFRKVTQGSNEKIVERGRDPDVVNAMRAILAAYGVAPRLEKSALAYMETVAKNDPAMYAALKPSVDSALLNAKPLDELTLEELRGLNDELRAMWELAKRSRQMEVDGNLLDIEDAADALLARMEKIGIPAEIPGERAAITDSEEAGIKLQFAKAILSRVEQWAERMDGKFGGPFLRLVFQPVKEAADAYRAARVDYRKRFTALVENIAPILRPGEIPAPELGYTFGNARDSGQAELLHAILHTGNESNKRKLLLGRGWATEREDGTLDTSRWDAFIARMIAEGKLEKAHYDFAQGVWDLLEEMKPRAQETHRKVFGRYFAEVTATPFETPFGSYRGGYVPAQTDSRLVKDAKLRELAEAENESMAYAFPASPSGFTKARVEYNKPLLLDLRALAQHMDKVLLFSYMQGPVTDVRRLLTNKRVSYALDRIDPGAYEGMLIPWLNRSAKQIVETPVAGDRKLSRFLSTARSRAGMAHMFANLSNAFQQITGFLLATIKVKPSLLKKATASFIADPKAMKEQVATASVFMRDRMLNEVAAMNDAIEQILVNATALEKAQDWTQRHAYFLQAAVDNTMSPIVWTAAYNQATEKRMGHKDAVRFADGVVRQTQGSTLPEDISRFESGPAYARLFTQFFSYFNMLANTNATAMKQIVDEMGLRKGAGRLLYVALVGLLAQIWVAEAIAQAFRGGPEDEDDDGYLDDWLMAVFGTGTLRGITAMVPIVGQAAQLVVNRFNDNPADDKFSLSPAVSLLESAVSAPASVYKAIVDEGNAQKAVRDVAAAATLITGLPIYAAARPVGYLAGVADERIEPTGPVDMARGLVTGTASPESRAR